MSKTAGVESGGFGSISLRRRGGRGSAGVRPAGRAVRHGVPIGPRTRRKFGPDGDCCVPGQDVYCGRLAPRATSSREACAEPEHVTITPICLRGGHYMSAFVDEYMAWLKAKNPGEPEFHQAVQEVAESLEVVLDKNPKYRDAKILERIVEPERVIMFRVPVGRRQGRGPGQPRLPHRDEQRHRPLQGRPALPPDRLPRPPQVPRLRAGLQELAHHAAHGRRQGRLGLRPQGQERQRGHALLPDAS